MAELKRKSVRGGAVTMASQGIGIAIQLTSTAVLARLLTPGDYGVIAMVVAITSFAGLFRDLGLSSAAIQKKDLTRAQQSNLFWLNVVMGTLLTALVAAGAPLVVWFYSKPELYLVTVALSTSFFIASLSSQHGAMLVRNMQFVQRAVAGLTGAIVTLAVALILALNDYSYWALVWGNLAGTTTTTVLIVVLSPFRPGLISRGSGIRDMLKFGANITAFDFVNYFHRNLDNLLLGRYWGTGALGFYSRAYSLLLLPINILRGPINAVGFPALSLLSDNPESYRSYYRKLTNTLALASCPFVAYLFVTSEAVIHLVLGPGWDAIVPIFEILAAVALIQPTVTLWGMVLISRGLGSRYLYIGIFNTLASALGFLVGLRWGALGVAAGYACATYLSTYPLLHFAFRHTPVSCRDFFDSVARPLGASVLSAIICRFLILAPLTLSPMLQLVTSALVFPGLYLLFLRLLPGRRSELILLDDAYRLARSWIARKKATRFASNQ